MGATWRVSFGLLIPVILYVIYYRIYVLKELQLLKDTKKRNAIQGASLGWLHGCQRTTSFALAEGRHHLGQHKAAPELWGPCAGYDWTGFGLLMTHYWHRLFGTAGIWFCNGAP